MAIAEAFAGAVQGLANVGTDIYNLWQQDRAYNWNKEMQLKAWEREDNAVQRRVRDLKLAGLSPVLAAGSSAQASGPIQVSGPQLDKSNALGNVLQSVLASKNIQQMNAGIAQTQAQAKLIDAQYKGQLIANKVNQRDYNLSVGAGTSSKPGVVGSALRDVKGAVDSVGNYADSGVKALKENTRRAVGNTKKGYEFVKDKVGNILHRRKK